MRWSRLILVVAASLLMSTSYSAESDAREQFDNILEGINDRSFKKIKGAIDEKEMTARVYAAREIDAEAKRWFDANFWELVEDMFTDAMPGEDSKHDVEAVQFEFMDGKGYALLRHKKPGYTYEYHAIELLMDSRSRMKIADVRRYNVKGTFSDEIAQYLITISPTKSETSRLLQTQDISDGDLFQVTELLKAYRDQNTERFFKIFGDLDSGLQKDPLLANYAVLMASTSKDEDQRAFVMQLTETVFGENPDYALALADVHLAQGQLEDGYKSLLLFKSRYKLVEGAAPARLSALALAIGNNEEAIAHAEDAVQLEPSLELGWWSLLRARVATGDYAAAIEPLTQLEDRFGHQLTPAKLNRDRWQAFATLAEAQEYKDWRASRP